MQTYRAIALPDLPDDVVMHYHEDATQAVLIYNPRATADDLCRTIIEVWEHARAVGIYRRSPIAVAL